jgi:FPC/CPF motif-containing protein YcgG
MRETCETFKKIADFTGYRLCYNGNVLITFCSSFTLYRGISKCYILLGSYPFFTLIFQAKSLLGILNSSCKESSKIQKFGNFCDVLKKLKFYVMFKETFSNEQHEPYEFK